MRAYRFFLLLQNAAASRSISSSSFLEDLTSVSSVSDDSGEGCVSVFEERRVRTAIRKDNNDVFLVSLTSLTTRHIFLGSHEDLGVFFMAVDALVVGDMVVEAQDCSFVVQVKAVLYISSHRARDKCHTPFTNVLACDRPGTTNHTTASPDSASIKFNME